MDILPPHFRILRFFGLWSETGNDNIFVRFIWRPFNIIAMVLFSILLLGSLRVYRNNVADFTECLFLSLMYFGLCFKLVNWLCRRDAMVNLLDEFRMKVCVPRDDHERKMIRRYARISAIVFNVHIGFAHFSNLSFSISPIMAMLAGAPEKFLPFKTYEILDMENLVNYWMTYAFEVTADIIGIFVNVTLDTMLAGFLLLTCGQIDLCCYRFMSSSNDVIQKSIKECVVHQLLIRRIVSKLEAFFMPVAVPLMFLSLITFCTSVYNISQSSVGGVDSISFFTYLVCLLCQLCCYCWFGNELKLKSSAISDNIYNSDWTLLRPLDRKSLYFIMLSCQKEMTVSFHGLCALTIEIFVWVLKTSYSAFNLLKTVE